MAEGDDASMEASAPKPTASIAGVTQPTAQPSAQTTTSAHQG
jgi:hypothetical protein